MHIKVILIFVMLFLFSGELVRAQEGTIKVIVVDDTNGEPLTGASVLIEGTSTGNVADMDGIAVINVPAGVYNLRVSYVSYQTLIVTGVNVENEETTSLTVRLKTHELQIDEVVVTAKAVQNSENALLTLQKKSPKLFDAITSDQFSKMGVSDAAGALKRVTGVTIAGGKYVYVRGLGDRYSKANLNSSEVPSLDPNKNSLQLDLFPSNLIDNIIVYKTFTPDLQGDFAGGLVDITTKDFPDDFIMQVSAGISYNGQANFNKGFLSAEGSKTDFLGYDNGFRSLPGEIGRYTPVNFPDPYLDKEAITTVSRAFDNTQFAPTRQSPYLNHKLSFSIGDQLQLFKKPLGYILGFSYNRNYSSYSGGTQNVFEGISQGQQTLDNDVLSASIEDKSTEDVLSGAMFNTSYKINNHNKVGISLLANQAGTSEIRYQVGYLLDASPDSATQIQNRAISYLQRSFRNGQVRGEHLISGLNDLTIKWSNSFTLSAIKQPDFRVIRNQFSMNQEGDSLFYLGNLDRPSRFYRDLSEVNENLIFDFILPLSLSENDNTKLKFGSFFTYKDRVFRENIYQYNIQSNKNFDGDIQVFFQDDNLGYVDNTLKNFLININIEDNNYDAYQRLWASYIMVESSILENLNLITGIRFEKTNMHLRAKNNSTGTIQTNDFLPSLALTYNISDQSNLRVSASRTLARPSFREFAPLATYDFLGGYIQNGNPNLKRTLINNLDLRWEKFPAPGEYMALSLFYKKFIDPIENAQIPRAGGSTSQFQYKNVAESQLFGAEVEIRKNLGEWLVPLNNFKISTNFSYVHAYVKITPQELMAIEGWKENPEKTRPMYDQAPYSLNASLSYENNDSSWESAISFNVSGKRLVVYQIDLPSIYLQPMPDLNFTIKRNISDSVSIRFRMENLLNNTYKEQIDLADKVYYTTKYQSGRTYSLSFIYKVD